MAWPWSPRDESRAPLQWVADQGQKVVDQSQKLHSTISNNHGVNMTGNNQIQYRYYAKTTEEKYVDMLKVLLLTTPSSDRQAIIMKGKSKQGAKNQKEEEQEKLFDWILSHSKYRHWKHPMSRSQLLWIYGQTGTAKTWMSVWLTQKHDEHCQHLEIINLYYFCAKNEEKRNTAASILRALIRTLLKARPELLRHFSDEYECQQEHQKNIFLTSVSDLWSIFETMLRDPITGPVYCLIDGLNECDQDSLMPLINCVANFMRREPKTVLLNIDDNQESSKYTQYSNMNPGAMFKLILVSREEPKALQEVLSGFEKFRLGGGQAKTKAKQNRVSCDYTNIAQSASAASTATPYTTAENKIESRSRLAAVAIAVMKQQKMANLQGAVDSSHDLVARTNELHLYNRFGSAVSSVAPTSAYSVNSDTPSTAYTVGSVAPSSAYSVVSAAPSSAYSVSSTAPSSAYSVSSMAPSSAYAASRVSSPTAYSAYSFGSLAPCSSSNSIVNIAESQSQESLHPPLTEQAPGTTIYEPETAVSYNSTLSQYQQYTPAPHSEAVELPGDEPVNIATTAETLTPAADNPVMDEQEVEALDSDNNSENNVEEDAYDLSIEMYATSKCEKLAESSAFSTDQLMAIKHALLFHGDGSFLWIDLAIDQIRTISPLNLETTLAHVPAGVDEMYCLILSHVPRALEALVATILKWVVSAKQPLTREQLIIVLGLPRDDLHNEHGWLAQGLASCSSLIHLSEETDTISLAHTSVSDFLTGDSSRLLQDVGLSVYFVRVREMDAMIASVCIKYLESGCLAEGAVEGTAEGQAAYEKRSAQFPFMWYASSFWFLHLQTAYHPSINITSPFFLPKSKCRKAWFQSYWTFTMQRSNYFAPRDFNLVHLAAYFDVMPLAEAMRLNGMLWPRLETRDSHGNSPLDYSIKAGNYNMFVFLVAQGAKTTANSSEKSALDIACQSGQVDIVKYLASMGHNIHHKTHAIHWSRIAVKVGRYTHGLVNESVGLDQELWNLWLNANPGDDQMPIHKAAACGHADVVDFLLDHGADVHARTTLGWTSLHFASFAGRMECVELLHMKGANIFAITTATGWLPMHAAASRGKQSVVRYFLNLHVPVNVLTAKEKTVLHIAAKYSQIELIRFLVKQGIDIDAKTSKGDTALHCAVTAVSAEAVETLLVAGANRLVVNKQGETPRQTLKTVNKPVVKEIVRILESFGSPDYKPYVKPLTKENLSQLNAPNMSQTPMSPNVTGVNHDKSSEKKNDHIHHIAHAHTFPGTGNQNHLVTPVPTSTPFHHEASGNGTGSYFPPPSQLNPMMNTPPPPYQPSVHGILTPLSPPAAYTQSTSPQIDTRASNEAQAQAQHQIQPTFVVQHAATTGAVAPPSTVYASQMYTEQSLQTDQQRNAHTQVQQVTQQGVAPQESTGSFSQVQQNPQHYPLPHQSCVAYLQVQQASQQGASSQQSTVPYMQAVAPSVHLPSHETVPSVYTATSHGQLSSSFNGNKYATPDVSPLTSSSSPVPAQQMSYVPSPLQTYQTPIIPEQPPASYQSYSTAASPSYQTNTLVSPVQTLTSPSISYQTQYHSQPPPLTHANTMPLQHNAHQQNSHFNQTHHLHHYQSTPNLHPNAATQYGTAPYGAVSQQSMHNQQPSYSQQGMYAQQGLVIHHQNAAITPYFAPPPMTPQLQKKKSMLDGFFKS